MVIMRNWFNVGPIGPFSKPFAAEPTGLFALGGVQCIRICDPSLLIDKVSKTRIFTPLVAKVVELVDTLDLGSSSERNGGSSPPFRIL